MTDISPIDNSPIDTSTVPPADAPRQRGTGLPTAADGRTRPTTVVGPYLQPVIDAAAEYGISRQTLAQAARIDVPEPLPPFLSGDAYLTLLQTASTLSNDNSFGLTVGRQVRPATFGLLGVTLLSCSHLGQALEHVIRWEELVHQLGQSRVDIVDDVGVLSWSSTHGMTALVDSIFAGIMNFSHWLSGRRVPLLRVEFMHAIKDKSPYERFFQCPVIDQSPRHALVCETAILAWPVIQADPGLLISLQEMASKLLMARERESGLVRHVRRLISDAFPRQLKLEDAARALSLSPRTLQRRLQALDTHFQQELDRVRQSTAEDYLRYSRSHLTEIAYFLGYQEQSSFTHAFKAWTGMSPGEYRRKYAIQT